MAADLSDEELDALDTFALFWLAPRGRESVRAFACAAIAADRALNAPQAAPVAQLGRQHADDTAAMIPRMSTDTDHPMAAVVDAFQKAREACRFYQGIKDCGDSVQCAHDDNSRPGAWCAMDCCPLLRERAEWVGIGWN